MIIMRIVGLEYYAVYIHFSYVRFDSLGGICEHLYKHDKNK